MAGVAYKMTAKELKSIRTSMNLDIKSMAAVLGWPYRTYQDRELGSRGIPDSAADQVRGAQARDRQVMRDISARTAARIHRDYPQGIPSAPIDTGADP